MRACMWPECPKEAVTVGRPYFVGYCDVWWYLLTVMLPFFGPHLYWTICVERARINLCGEHYLAFKSLLHK